MHKAWDELTWPLPSSSPPTPKRNEPHGFIQGQTVELGPTMPPTQFQMSSPTGEFICFARGLIFEGAVLAYDLVSTGAEWIPVRGTTQDLSRAEMSALALENMVPHSPDAELERLNRFGESRDAGTVGSKGGGGCHSDKDEDTLRSQDTEEGAGESDLDDEEDNSQQGGSINESEDRTDVSQLPGSSPSCRTADKHLYSHSGSWGSKCESKGVEEG